MTAFAGTQQPIARPDYRRRLIATMLLIAATVPAHAFGLDDVTDKARALAAQPYQPPKQIPDTLRQLSYDQYRSIRFDPDKQLWARSGSRFGVMLIMPGLFFTHPVKVNIIDSTGVSPLAFDKDLFQSDDPKLLNRIPGDLGYAGFKLTFPINHKKVQDQFLSFAGASYFRAVGRNDHFGISARGAALDTGLLSGEEFPDFVEYWLERPAGGADTMRIYALMDSKRITGAYEFIVRPGAPTRMDVRAVLFTRDKIPLLGIAPLTSMFYYGENTARPLGHWRPEVHDSDGLLIHNGTDEWLWNPLHNPKSLSIQAFSVKGLKGFGLLQRDTRFADYQDPEARYDNRPSTWVTPQDDWGDGRIMLIQIPTSNETNDNIVAFWSPPEEVAGGQTLNFRYQLTFSTADQQGSPVADLPLGHVADTFIGRGDVIGGGDKAGTYRVLIDFKGGALDGQKPDAPVTSAVSAQEGGEVLEHFVTYMAPSKSWRLSILARPAKDKPLALRAGIVQADKPLTETWTYTLDQDNTIIDPGQ